MPSMQPSTSHPTSSQAPSAIPSASPTCVCVNLRPPLAPNGEWHELNGEGRFTCALYESEPDLCLTIGGDRAYGMYGHVANSACCVCGGGACAIPSRSPSQYPSFSPSFNPSLDEPSKVPSSNELTSFPVTSAPSTRPSLLPSIAPFESKAPSFDAVSITSGPSYSFLINGTKSISENDTSCNIS